MSLTKPSMASCTPWRHDFRLKKSAIAGTSLIEVLVASVVVALGTLALLSTQGLQSSHVRQESARQDALDTVHDAVERQAASIIGLHAPSANGSNAVHVERSADERMGWVVVRAWQLWTDVHGQTHHAQAQRWVVAPSAELADDAARLALARRVPAPWPLLAPAVPAP